MKLTRQAQEERPRKPMNGFFKYRNKRMEELKHNPQKKQIVKLEWRAIPESDKQKMTEQFKKELQKWDLEMQEWKIKFNLPGVKKKPFINWPLSSQKIKRQSTQQKPQKSLVSLMRISKPIVQMKKKSVKKG